MHNVFTSIEHCILTGRDRGRNKFFWSLPRQVGATSWFLERIKYDLVCGYTVVYAGPRHILDDVRRDEELYEYTKSKRLLVITPDIHRSHPLRGYRVDRIYCDNLRLVEFQPAVEFIASVSPLLNPDGYMVMIDTTEGII